MVTHSQEKVVRPRKVWMFRQRGGLESFIQFPMQLQAPRLDFVPRNLAAPDREQTISMLFYTEGNKPLLQNDNAGQK